MSKLSMKIKTQYACQSCGHLSPKWLGRCPGCEAWNTLAEEISAGPSTSTAEGSIASAREEFKSIRDLQGVLPLSRNDWEPLDDGSRQNKSESTETKKILQKRFGTGISELDRVLGGGLVWDGFTLLGGDPGVGKSTLLLQMCKGLVEGQPELKLLYVSGEESTDQIRGRARRMGVRGEGRVFLAAETQLEKVFATVKELKPDVLIMDSLQTFSSGFLESAPGSVGQLREVAARLMALAKTARVSVCLVGHVTKDGSIAGPKTVEHMVDTVLYFEGEGSQSHRLLRTVKNRFGSSQELGVFEMTSEGLREVSNPSSLFLSERKSAISGTAVGVSLEGSRPIFAEFQALVVHSGLALPRRTAVGMDSSRVSLLAAILERHMGLSLAQQDLFFNVVGGLRISEPACDLAAAASIWSSFEKRAFPCDWVFIGELGLTGEVRRVSQIELRLQEAMKLGFKTIVLPDGSARALAKNFLDTLSGGIRLARIQRIDEVPRLI